VTLLSVLRIFVRAASKQHIPWWLLCLFPHRAEKELLESIVNEFRAVLILIFGAKTNLHSK
jgi:hypothetical protein